MGRENMLFAVSKTSSTTSPSGDIEPVGVPGVVGVVGDVVAGTEVEEEDEGRLTGARLGDDFLFSFFSLTPLGGESGRLELGTVGNDASLFSPRKGFSCHIFFKGLE